MKKIFSIFLFSIFSLSLSVSWAESVKNTDVNTRTGSIQKVKRIIPKFKKEINNDIKQKIYTGSTQTGVVYDQTWSTDSWTQVYPKIVWIDFGSIIEKNSKIAKENFEIQKQ